MPSSLPDHLQPLFRGFVHEIRNPMSAVLTAAALLRDPASLAESDIADLLKVVEEETRHMNRVVNEFDRYLHVPPPVKERFDVAAVTRRAINDLRDKKVLSGNVKLVDELPPTLMASGDSAQISDAVAAILINAAEALQGSVQTPPLLALCPEQNSSQTAFLIRDNGEGFSAESEARAFEPFYSSRSGAATGMGLPLALALLHNNGGDLRIMPSEKKGQGACLRLSLPK
jgi:nitrogen fixation/metabolism regulation signal transduction histidine kinase